MTEREQLEVCFSLLHKINIYSSITLDNERMGELIDAINAWSYSHRRGNGQFSEEEQQELVDKAFLRLKELVLPKCKICEGTKVVSLRTDTCKCLCFTGCILCKNTGMYEVTTIADCPECGKKQPIFWRE